MSPSEEDPYLTPPSALRERVPAVEKLAIQSAVSERFEAVLPELDALMKADVSVEDFITGMRPLQERYKKQEGSSFRFSNYRKPSECEGGHKGYMVDFYTTPLNDREERGVTFEIRGFTSVTGARGTWEEVV